MIRFARSGSRPAARATRAGLATLAGLPFLFAMMAVYRLLVTFPEPEGMVAATALRAASVLVMVAAMTGTIAIVHFTARRLTERACAGTWKMDAGSAAPERARQERPA